tara:strand:- start:1092 stop:1322 length:231 start_codon:yes stop_codon:yes gene_type:complete
MKKNLIKNFIVVVTILFSISVLMRLFLIFILPDIEFSIYIPSKDYEYIIGDYLIFIGLVLEVIIVMIGLKIIRNFQ